MYNLGKLDFQLSSTCFMIMRTSILHSILGIFSSVRREVMESPPTRDRALLESSAMASGCVPDIWQWIKSLPERWIGGSYSLQICSSPSTNQSLKLVISRHSETQPLNLSFSICAEFHDSISLWSSNYSRLRSSNATDASARFLHDIICGVLQYGPYSNRRSLVRLPSVQIPEDSSGKIFNIAALTLAILVSIYEAPSSLRREFIDTISAQLMRRDMGDAAKKLMLTLGSNVEEQWMLSVNLGVTNWTMECLRSGVPASPAAVFSYAVSETKLWKVQVYCPVVAMDMEHPSHQTKDERLLFSLNYQQLESVIQLVCRVSVKENWIDVSVNVDNIRCDVVQLVSESLMARQGYGSDEKHFPSRVSLQLTPMSQPDVLSLSVSRSTDNPVHEVGLETGLDASLGSGLESMGLAVSAHETVTRAVRPWKFEHAVHGNTASLSWFLHGGAGGGREVFSAEPRRLDQLFRRPGSWFRNRYTSASRPFTRGGGVIFAGDEYGEGVRWRLCPAAAGKAVEWEIRGRVWVTYWPNNKRTMHTETRMIEFRELLKITLAE
ncbi:hypothetical protein EJB05_03282 [Eragrostis curvula]|uniref:Uncharacterized protein n=1 Tax=Eragrostis curvula TaxID=38414 RepID=A0A5J9WKF7_9POAL|nr:hypothetical protein EJB05_03282 [Eragrostis curvula]